MLVINTLLHLLLPLLLGVGIVNLICRDYQLPLYVRLALGFGLGTSSIAHWMVILAYFQIPFSALAINLPIAIMTVLLFIFCFRYSAPSRIKHAPHDKGKLDLIGILCGMFIVTTLSQIFWSGLNFPIFTWDTFSTMGFKGRIIYHDQGIPNLANVGKFAYPIHLPLTLSWLSFSLGYWDDQSVKYIFPITCFCFTLIKFFFLRNFTSLRYALLGVVLLLSANFLVFHSTIAYRDITMMYYNCTAIFMLVLWFRNKQTCLLILASVFSGMASSIKTEGIGYLGIHTGLLILLLLCANFLTNKQKFIGFLTFLMTNVGIYSIYNLYRKFYILPFVPKENIEPTHFDLSHVSINLSTETLIRLQVVLRRYLEDFILSGNWNLVWPIFFASCFNLLKQKPSVEKCILILALLAPFAIYIPSFVLTQHYLWVAETRDVLSRSLLHSFPLVCALIILLNFDSDSKPLTHD